MFADFLCAANPRTSMMPACSGGAPLSLNKCTAAILSCWSDLMSLSRCHSFRCGLASLPVIPVFRNQEQRSARKRRESGDCFAASGYGTARGLLEQPAVLPVELLSVPLGSVGIRYGTSCNRMIRIMIH